MSYIDLNNLGSFASINALWAAYPEGGQEGDYCTIDDVKYRWDKYDRMWVADPNFGPTPARSVTTFDGDVNMQNNLTVAGYIRAKGIKQPCLGLFASLTALEAKWPDPEVGMWALVGDSISITSPAAVYRCDTDGTWAATGGTAYIDGLEFNVDKAITGWVPISSTSQLPANPTPEQQGKGYLLDSTLYVYVGEGGDTLSGKYQSAQLKGGKGDQGNSGYSGAADELEVVNNLTDGGETAALSAEMGKVLNKRLTDVEDVAVTGVEVATAVTLTMHTESNTNGYYNTTTSGGWVSDNTRRGSEKIDVAEGEKYLVTTKIGASTAIAYLGQWNDTTWVGVATGFTGGSGDAVDKEYIVPSGVTKIAICSYNTTAPSLKKVTTDAVATFYTKDEADTKFAEISSIPSVINNLTTGGTTDTLSAEQGKVLNEKIEGKPSVSLVKSDYELSLGMIASGKFRTDANYGLKNKYALVPMSDYKGRTLAFAHVSGHTYNTIAFLTSSTLVSGETAPFCEGYTDTTTTAGNYTIPQDCNYLYVYAEREGNDSWPSLTITATDPQVCTDARADVIESRLGQVASKFGVKWSATDFDDLGTRVFDAVGMTATIGVGSTNGSSDFDSIYPWSEMKRCNIKVNSNGAKIVTFEGEIGFALDGTNGDVFVRIPKFKTNHYVDNGYEYLVIGEGYTHPAFVENGVELDEIFIGAFEASKVGSALYSKAGDLPANNMTGAEFLTAAQARGTNYSLYDMRCVDALWRLMAVEYGCRNSNRILGYGYADYVQPVATSYSTCVVTQASTSTNTVVGGTVSSASNAVIFQTCFAAGNVITICDTTQQNIIAQRKITAVSAVNGQALSVTFDGEPIDVTTSMFFGNGGIYTNYCESISSISASYALSWHTGRANRPVVAGSGMDVEAINPCRYRWVENPVGNIWHSLPDVTFKDRQMYVCKNMKDYVMLKYTAPYYPVGDVLPLQDSNGNKLDVNASATPNYWITSLLNDTFAKGNSFGKTFDATHDGTITSKKGFGGYYYLKNNTRYIANGGGFDHLWRCNMLTNRAWQSATSKWYLEGARLMYKNIDILAEAE